MASIPIPILKDETYTFDGFVSQADKQESDYLLLPFAVPDGIVRLDVRYEYSDETGAELWAPSGNVIDLGVFDSRGSEFITARGFRGTSGSFRHEFSIGLHEATPGYLAGPIYSGRWCIILGLYRIVPGGCHYRVAVEMTQGEAEPISEVEPYDAGVLCSDARWYKGDLHCHTHHSDASGTLGDLVQSARARGLDFLAVTDHNTISHLREFARYATADLLLIPGEEITTYYGHANVWGIEKWHDFRAGCAADMQRIIDEASRSGSLVSINHPKEEGPPWTFESLRGYDCIEAWQAYWFVNNYQSL
ncbi:MAG: CehA/McbA family metallohydrolase, partial [Chloroflexota bacterium]